MHYVSQNTNRHSDCISTFQRVHIFFVLKSNGKRLYEEKINTTTKFLLVNLIVIASCISHDRSNLWYVYISKPFGLPSVMFIGGIMERLRFKLDSGTCMDISPCLSETFFRALASGFNFFFKQITVHLHTLFLWCSSAHSRYTAQKELHKNF